MFTPDIDQSRQLLYDTWHKYQTGQTLEGIEQLIIVAIQRHPHYQALLEHPQKHSSAHYLEHVNPFLDIWLQVSLLEQLSINQPHGIQALYQQVLQHTGSQVHTDRICIEALQEVLDEAQRQAKSTPDAVRYFELIIARSGLSVVK